ncbi:MAG: hypothetical protein ACHREM_05635 [Polyangiales bacterium]
MKVPNAEFGLIKVRRPLDRVGKDFQIGERFQGQYQLNDGLMTTAPAWLKDLVVLARKSTPLQEAVCSIENKDMSDYGIIEELNLVLKQGPLVFAYRYLDGSPIAGTSTFTVVPEDRTNAHGASPSDAGATSTTTPESAPAPSCVLTQVFQYQEQHELTAVLMSGPILKLHDQVVWNQAKHAVDLMNASDAVKSGKRPPVAITASDIPIEYR